MRKKKLSCGQIDEFIMDEKKAAKYYKGFTDPVVQNFAEDEAKHARYMKKIRKKC